MSNRRKHVSPSSTQSRFAGLGRIRTGPDCPHENLRQHTDDPDSPVQPASTPSEPVPVSARLAVQKEFDFEAELHCLIQEEMVRATLIEFLERVLRHPWLATTLCQPVEHRQLPLISLLRVAGLEACRSAGLEPWPQDLLYTATVLLGLQLYLDSQDPPAASGAGICLRDIAAPAYRALQEEGRTSAARLASLLGWCTADDSVEWQRDHVLHGLRKAGLLAGGC